ncbi:MAG: lysyl oxidase family protein [Candidatus Promineifilaceae bacterium]|nr:lysyl oxidase family protein [Candidatus Promineifilaceae bacterium]
MQAHRKGTPDGKLRYSLLGLLMVLGAVALVACQRSGQDTPTAAPTAATTRPGLAAVSPTSPATPTTTALATNTAESTVNDSTGDPSPTPSPTLTPTPTITPLPEAAPSGALIAVSMVGQVGVLLDELPADVRDAAATSLLDQPLDFWEALAQRQVRLTQRRLNFRNFVYEDKGQLPLPPSLLWSIDLGESGPSRQQVMQEGVAHDLVLVDYRFESTLLTDTASAAEAEPELAEIGGVWREPYLLPLDPDLLLQRTGNACLNEAGFPPNSYDSENAWIFFDYTCQADSGGELGCHRIQLPSLSCAEALVTRIGTMETDVVFERLPWDEELAAAARVGDVTHVDGPDLKVVAEDLAINRVEYRYFPTDSCALVEQCVGGAGWRRILKFTATVHNVGAEAMHVGPVEAEDPEHNLFQYNACHNHFHFSDYGDFFFADAERNFTSKQAFCVESTSRFSNNEFSPLTHPYSCRFQGVQAGWVDEYHAGLDCQWIDITDAALSEEAEPVSLGFISNPDQFLCEGALVRDEAGDRLWEPSGLTTADGRPIERPQCDFVEDWDVNNEAVRDVVIGSTGSFVTEPCQDYHLGPLRNCDFSEQLDGISGLAPESAADGAPAGASEAAGENTPFTCAAGQSVQLTCDLTASAPQVIRICEYSEQLETGVACTYSDALANVTVTGTTDVSFQCPLVRDENEPGGAFSLYTAPLLPEDEAAPVSCAAAP